MVAKRLSYFVIILVLSILFWFSKSSQIVLGGVALFFLGMMLLEGGMKKFAGGTLERILKSTTDTTPKAIATGFFTTALVQSSSLVSLIAISFLSAGLIKLAAGIGIVFGSNIGTTVTAWLVAAIGLKLQISHYALAMAAFGTLFSFVNTQTSKGLSNILLGLALLLLAIGFMKEGFETIKESIDLAKYAMGGFLGLIVYLAIGIFATVVMQSSSAAMALVLTALATNQITYENSLALAIGANIGTTITAILGAIQSSAIGKRLAGAHLIFNLVTGAVAIIFLAPISSLVDIISHSLSITDLALKLSIFHTIFNLLGIIIMTPFINIMQLKLGQMFKEKRKKKNKPKFLSKSLLNEPIAAIAAIKSECEHLYDNSFEVLSHAINLNRKDIRSSREMKEIVETSTDKIIVNIDVLYKQKVKGLYDAIVEYSTWAQTNMSQEQIIRVYDLKMASRDIVNSVKDMQKLEANFKKYGFSDNQAIKKEYNLIRELLGNLLRKVEEIRRNPNDENLIIKFVEIRRLLEENDRKINDTVGELIRSEQITASMGTSLMNDSGFAYAVGKEIIGFIEIVYIQSDEHLSIVYDELLAEE